MEKQKKPLHKKPWVWLIAVIVVFGIIGSFGEDEKETGKKESKPAATEPVKDKPKEKKEPEKKKEEPIKEEKKKEKKENVENLPIDQKIVKKNSNIKEAKLNDGRLELFLDGDSSWSENTVVTTHTYWGFEATKEGFDDKSVNEVQVTIQATLTDNKGNESVQPVETFEYTRATFEELNYDNFINMASGEEWRILNEADGYFIHPAIYNNVKEKHIEKLTHGKSKVRKYE